MSGSQWFLRFFPVLSLALLVGRVSVSQGYYVCSGCRLLSIPTTNTVNIIIVMIIMIITIINIVMIIIDHHQQNISQRYSVGAAWPFSPLPCGGVLHINSYHILLSFHFVHFFLHVYIPLFIHPHFKSANFSVAIVLYFPSLVCIFFTNDP